jgi:hypothetical protein
MLFFGVPDRLGPSFPAKRSLGDRLANNLVVCITHFHFRNLAYYRRLHPIRRKRSLTVESLEYIDLWTESSWMWKTYRPVCITAGTKIAFADCPLGLIRKVVVLQERRDRMADRKQFLHPAPVDPELADLLNATKEATVSDEELREQRISFAFGNALGSETITKESVRNTSQHIRLL